MFKMAIFRLLLLKVAIFVAAAESNNPLDFRSAPTTVKANENFTVLLPCYLNTSNNDGVIVVRVKWYKDEDILADSGPPAFLPPDRYKLWGNGSLEVVDVQPMDTGEYTCEIIRSAPWSPIRQVHAIEVLHPPSIEPNPLDGYLEVKLGEEVFMECKGHGVPNPIITWRTKGEDMRLIDNRNALSFTASDRNLAGLYECRAVNGVGEPAKAEINLRIIYPPELITLRSWIHSAPGLRVQMECKVSADPPATVTWFKGENPIHLDNRVVAPIDGDKHILLIRNVHRSDFGIYTCSAVNDLGQATLEFQVSGVPNPGVFKSTDDKNVDAKNSYTLIWEVDSYTPIIEYNLWFRPYHSTTTLRKQEWTKLTIPTEHNTNSGPVYSKMYTIKGLKEKTIYEALLVSRNRYGWSKASSTLRFATSGTDLKEEIITPVHIETEQNIIPLEVAQPNGGTSSRRVLPYTVIFIIYFCCFVYCIDYDAE